MLILKGHTGPVQCVSFSPAEPVLISAGNDRQVRLWDIAAAREVRAFPGGKEGIYSLAVSRDGKCVATGGLDEEVRLFDIASGKELWAGPGHFPALNALAFSPDGKDLAAAVGDRFKGSESGEVRI